MGRRMPVSLRATAVVLGAAALLTACGGGEPAPVTIRSSTLHLKLTEYRIYPQNVTIQATARPLRLQVVAKNVGKLTHNIVIRAEDQSDEQGVADPDDQPTVYMKSSTAHPGETVTKTAFLQPGTYRLTDTIGNHDNLGQYGELKILPPRG
jgi:uncharacterized cupredoxin-like copper-binding protein